jgi:trigger factor
MKYTFEIGKKSTVKLTIKLTEKEWKESIEAAYQKTKGRYSIPGFRKGKVPKKVLEASYGVGIFFEDAINIAFPKYYEEILDKEPSIFAVASPEIDIKDISEKSITMIAVVPVKPEVTLGEYKGINFKKNVYNVEEAEINAELTRLQERNSRMVEVTDRAVKDGDTVIIDYSGSVDGVKFEGGTAQKQTLVIGSKSFIPGFEDQIIGMKKGEDKDINVKFPKEYHAENLKDKDAVFAIKLHEIKVKELPEVNDEFIKEATGTATVAEYKAQVKEKLEKQNRERAEREFENALLKKITEGAEVEIPDALVENQIDNMVRDMEYRLSYQGLKLEDYLKYLGKTMKDFRKEYEAQAKDMVKSQLVIDKIITEEKIEATEEEVEKRFEEMAKAQNKPVPDVKKYMNARQLDYIKDDIIIKKLFEILKKENPVG